MDGTVGVIGYGRFGRLWASILAERFDVLVYDDSPDACDTARSDGRIVVRPAEVCAAGAVFFCVPISAFEASVAAALPHLLAAPSPPTVIDVLSVKTHPRDVLTRLLPHGHPAILMHPMFGPDSVASGGLAGQPLVVDRFRAGDDAFETWLNFFTGRGIVVIEMSADEHDRLAADGQGVTHFVGRTLERFGFAPTPIDTLGTRKLHEITDQVCNDTPTLFRDLQTFNPYTRDMRVRLSLAQDAVFDQLLPNRIHADRLLVGIQGGRGSFNEEAARYYMSRTPDAPYELVYLHQSEAVLRALHEGAVDRGIFAIHNSIGGMVGESVQAMSHYRFDIVEEFAIKISHALMVAGNADFAHVDTIMTHPQVLAQCSKNLREKYGRLRQTSGEGDLVDHAKVAELLAAGEIPPTVATMGSRVLAEINGLRIVEDNLQDLDQNFTSFLWVQRPLPASEAG